MILLKRIVTVQESDREQEEELKPRVRQSTEEIIEKLFSQLDETKGMSARALASFTGLSVPTVIKYMGLICNIQERPKIEIHIPQKASGEVFTSEIVYVVKD